MGTKSSKYELRARAGKYKLGFRASKYKLGARAGKYKLGIRAWGSSWGPGSGSRAKQRARDWETQRPQIKDPMLLTIFNLT